MPDLRGHGRSEHQSNYSLATMCADVAQLFEPTDRIHVIGHSLGGALGAFLGTGWFGCDVRSVLGLSIKVKWVPEEIKKAREVAQAPVRWFETHDEATQRYLKIAGLTTVAEAAARSAAAGVVEVDGKYRLAADPKIFGCAALGIDSILKAARCEVRFASGGRDPIAPNADMAAAGLPSDALGDHGHNVHLEAPDAVWELFNRIERR